MLGVGGIVAGEHGPDEVGVGGVVEGSGQAVDSDDEGAVGFGGGGDEASVFGEDFGERLNRLGDGIGVDD